MVTIRSAFHAVIGAGLTAGAGLSGAGLGEALAPGGTLATALGLVAAVAAFAAWVDSRMDNRFAERDRTYAAQADARDERLLRKVEEMLHRE